jgi:hypothetical protein
MSGRGARGMGAAALVAVAGLLSSCDLTFSASHEVAVVSPTQEQLVSLPVVFRWSSTARADRYFAVFVDRAPIAPGQSLLAVASPACRRTPGCFDVAYLAQHDVFVTSSHTLKLDQVPSPSTALLTTQAPGVHQATIVVLDGEGRRVGESATTVEFRVRGGSQ